MCIADGHWFAPAQLSRVASMNQLVLASILVVLALPASVRAVELEAGAGRESLSRGADWKSAYLEAEQKFAERRVVYGALRATERFGQDDRDWMAGFYHPLDERWTLNAEAGTSPSHHVLPAESLALNLQRQLGDGWGVGFGGRHTGYADADTNAASLNVERYFGAYRAAYTYTTTHLGGAGASPSHRVQLSHYYGERSNVGLAASRGKEAENVPPGGVVTSEVRAVALVGRHWLDGAWALSYEAIAHEQGDFYRRRGLRLGLRRAF